MYKIIFALFVIAFVGHLAYLIATTVVPVDGLETLGCLTNRCVNINDQTFMFKE